MTRLAAVLVAIVLIWPPTFRAAPLATTTEDVRSASVEPSAQPGGSAQSWVKCDCDAEFVVTLHPELPVEVGHDALEAAFRAHRKAEAAKVDATTAHRKHETLPQV